MSSLYEGYPTITIESLLSGTPILTTDVAGAKEQIFNKEHGFIVENDDNSIETKLNELKGSKQLLTEYKLSLRDYYYDNKTILDKYYQLF